MHPKHGILDANFIYRVHFTYRDCFVKIPYTKLNKSYKWHNIWNLGFLLDLNKMKFQCKLFDTAWPEMCYQSSKFSKNERKKNIFIIKLQINTYFSRFNMFATIIFPLQVRFVVSIYSRKQHISKVKSPPF